MEARFLAGTLLVFAVLSFFVIREFLWYVVGGVLLVFAFYPIHKRLRKVVPRRTLAALLSFLLVITVVVGPLVLVVFMIYDDAKNFVESYNPDELNVTVQRFLEDYGIQPKTTDGNGTTRPGEWANKIGGAAKDFAEGITSELLSAAVPLILGLLIAAFVIYYGFAEGEEFYARLRHVIPLPDDIEEALFRDIRKVTNVVFIGNILVSVLGGIVGAISFVIFGVPNAVFWGFIMIILGILPLVGAPIIWGPAAFYLFTQGHVIGAVGILIINGGIVIGYVDNILRPKLIGKAANVHPILVLIGILGGLQAFGALGFVIGPLVLAIFIALIRSYTEWHPRWKERRARGDEKFSPGARIEIVTPPPPTETSPEPFPPPPSDAPEQS